MQLPPTATLEQAAALAAALPANLVDSKPGSGPLRIDASALLAFDSSTIALLMQAHRLALAAGRGFEVVGAPAKLAGLARLYGVEELLSLAPPPSLSPS
jgi:phospholipid transport system transporter-binding protein